MITSYCIFLRTYLLKILWGACPQSLIAWSVFGDLPFPPVRTPSKAYATSLNNSSHHVQPHSIIVERKDRQERKRDRPVSMVVFITQAKAISSL